MKPALFWGCLVGFSILLLVGCRHSQQTPTIPQISVTPERLPTHWLLNYDVRLPLVKNGSEFTPTPFLPIASTPVVPPTPIPQQDPGVIVNSTRPDTAPVTPIPPPMPLLGDQAGSGGDLINYLLIGSDQGSGSYFRTDTLIIASIRPRQQTVTLISIPRDLFVFIPGWTMQRINTAYLHGQSVKYPGGGAALLKDTIRYNLGIRIDHIAIVDFNGFKKIVDTLDGIDLPLVCPYTDWRVINPNGNLENPNNWRLFTVGPGLVHMDGEMALWYARSRLRSNDFDRGRRQQEALRAIYHRALKLNVLARLPDLYSQMNKIVRTDVDLNDILALAPMALKLDAPRIRSYYISNKYVKAWWTPEGANVLLPKREKIEPMLLEAMSPPDMQTEQRLSLIVEVSNGSGKEGLDVLAAERLHYAGYETRVTSFEGESISKTQLDDYSGGQLPDQLAFLLKYMGLPDERVVPAENPGNDAVYRLVLGRDYDPCFNPAKVNR
jgi:polyisoprenyl-teichoic acid--peptidoglycan teichoic acid transferase